MNKLFILGILLLAYNPLFSQGSFIINGGQVTVVGSGTIVLNNTQWINNGAFDAGTGTVVIKGDAPDNASAIGGTSVTTFHNLELNKSSNGAQLQQAAQVDNELRMTAGNLDLNSFDLTLGSAAGTITGESSDSYIHGDAGGEVVKTVDLNAPGAVNPGNLGAVITSAANLGSTTIRRGHQPQNVDGADGIKRYYDIAPTNNTDLNATLRLFYFDHELNGLAEVELVPVRDNGGGWDYYDATTADAAANYVETSNIVAFSVWTLARGAVKIMPVALLQGPYAGSGLMTDNLRNAGLLPTTEPYTGLGYTYTNGGGGEIVDPAVFNVTGNDAIVDWIVLELRDKNNPNTVVQSRAALLQRDGDIVGLGGDGPVSFPGAPADDYYLVVRHRNHLGVRSAGLVGMSTAVTNYDFRSSNAASLGGPNGIANLGDGNFGLFSGDFDANGQVQNTDFNNMILTLGTAGYRPGDFNLNGQVQNTDLQLKLIPNLGRGAQFNY